MYGVLGCMLLGTYVVAPLVRQHIQSAPTAVASVAAPEAAAPSVAPPPPIPPGQSAVHVTERAPAQSAAPKPKPSPETEPDQITPVSVFRGEHAGGWMVLTLPVSDVGPDVRSIAFKKSRATTQARS